MNKEIKKFKKWIAKEKNKGLIDLKFSMHPDFGKEGVSERKSMIGFCRENNLLNELIAKGKVVERLESEKVDINK